MARSLGLVFLALRVAVIIRETGPSYFSASVFVSFSQAVNSNICVIFQVYSYME